MNVTPDIVRQGSSTAQSTAAAPAAGAGSRGPELRVRRFDCVDYRTTWQQMREMTASRTAATADEIWVLEHPPVYTLGVAGRREHLPRGPSAIPVVHADRGGQVTYHGPGQIVIYLLLDLHRRGLTVKPLVRIMERAVIDLLASYGIAAEGRADAPGVYVSGSKIAALGLRIRRGCCYHGIALNVDMDLTPFYAIDPCGYPGLPVTQARDLGIDTSPVQLGNELVNRLQKLLS